MSVTSPAKEALVASDLKFCPEISNDLCNFDSVHVGEAADVTALFLDVEERSTSNDVGINAIVHINPEEALRLAIYLMDWAREHLEDLPTIGDFGVQEDIEDACDETWAEAGYAGFEPEAMYCQVCGQTLVNGQCPEDKFLIKAAPLHFPVSEPVQQAVDFECPCNACREWRMTH
jgi:hypothetical protein